MMDFSRRDFLKGLAASAISLGLDPFAGIKVATDLYCNRRLGLSFQKPSQWEFDSVADFTALRERQVVLHETAGEVHPLKNPDALPTVVISDPKYDEDDFSPGIALWDEILQYPNPPDAANEVLRHRHMIRNFGHFYKEVQAIEEPIALSVQGALGTQAVWSYLHELDDGRARMLTIRSLLFFRFQRVHTYYLIEPDEPDCVPPEAFNKVIQSIKYQ